MSQRDSSRVVYRSQVNSVATKMELVEIHEPIQTCFVSRRVDFIVKRGLADG